MRWEGTRCIAILLSLCTFPADTGLQLRSSLWDPSVPEIESLPTRLASQVGLFESDTLHALFFSYSQFITSKMTVESEPFDFWSTKGQIVFLHREDKHGWCVDVESYFQMLKQLRFLVRDNCQSLHVCSCGTFLAGGQHIKTSFLQMLWLLLDLLEV